MAVISSPISFRMMQDYEAPICGALVVDCILQRRGKDAIKGCPQKIASVWGQQIKVTAEKPQSLVIVAAENAHTHIQGVLAAAYLISEPRVLEIEHFYTLKSPEPIGKMAIAYLLENVHDADVIKVSSSSSGVSFYKEEIGFKNAYGALGKELFLHRHKDGAWDVAPKFAQKFMQPHLI
jgi:hypothetical protein